MDGMTFSAALVENSHGHLTHLIAVGNRRPRMCPTRHPLPAHKKNVAAIHSADRRLSLARSFDIACGAKREDAFPKPSHARAPVINHGAARLRKILGQRKVLPSWALVRKQRGRDGWAHDARMAQSMNSALCILFPPATGCCWPDMAAALTRVLRRLLREVRRDDLVGALRRCLCLAGSSVFGQKLS